MIAARLGSRPSTVLIGLAGAGLVVLASGRTWVRATVSGAASTGVITASGTLVAPGATALALVAAAGVVALVSTGRRVRPVVAVLLVLAGLGAAWLSGPVLADPAQAARPAVARATGTEGQQSSGPSAATAWPWLSAAGGLLIAVSGGVGLVRGRRWAGPSRRYERPADPTADRAGSPVPASGSGAAEGADPAPSAAAAGRDQRLDTWDALDRGEDPTV
jgi:uncharacterized membrane protein (TIGR02234 family)